jgi:ABC-type phosphate/phosphonate transport system permease subunit
MSLASQETLPMFTLEQWNTNLSPSVKVLIIIGMITALGTILAVILGLIFSTPSGG